ncbi:MAG: hypothetical protein ACYTFI_22090, partial [Planctomycetota bacterium]
IRNAAHGFFAYDYKLHDGPYTLIAYPEAPIGVSALPRDVQRALSEVTFDALSFAASSTLRPQDYFTCRDE